RGILETFIKEELLKRGYQPVYTPHIGRLELYRTSGHFPYYRDAQFPPMYFRPVASFLDLAQYRLAAGALDRATRQFFREYSPQAHFMPPGFAEARTNEEQMEVVHQYVLEMMRTTQLDIPDYHKATTYADRAKALLKWLEEQEGYLLKPMNCPHHIQ